MKRTLKKCNTLKGDSPFGAPSDDTARKLEKRSETQFPAMRLVKLELEIFRYGFGFFGFGVFCKGGSPAVRSTCCHRPAPPGLAT
jgi:hypothetical protein